MDRRHLRCRFLESDIEKPPSTHVASTTGGRARDEPYCFTDADHFSTIFTKFNEQRQDGRFVDCIVRVSSVKIPAHRSVIAACSPYFDALWRFNSSSIDDSNIATRGSEIVEVTLDANITSIEAVRALIDYAYIGSIQITYANVKELMKGADFLCMTPVYEECSRYLLEILDGCIAYEVYQFACSVNNDGLANGVVCFVAHHFYEFFSQEFLYRVDVDFLIRILAHDELVVMEELPFGLGKQFFFVVASRQEELVFRFIVEYVRQSADKSVLSQLLQNCVRFSLISPDRLSDLKKMDCVLQSKECQLVLSQAVNCNTGACRIMGNDLKSRDISDVMDCSWSRMKLATHAFDDIEDVNDFDDSEYHSYDAYPVLYITGMKFYSRRWDTRRIIGGIEVSYSSGLKLLHGGRNYGYEVDEFELDADERIIGVTAQSGWMVDGLRFETNKRSNLGPYGGDGGSRRVIERPARSAYLAFIRGKVMTTQNSTAVRHLQFGWVYNKNII